MRRFLILLSTVACLFAAGCGFFPEATFELAAESRLPQWFTLPPGVSRQNVSVTMSYYVELSGRTATIALYDTQKRELLKVHGVLRGLEPLKLKNSLSGVPSGYPLYEVITANGVTDVVEHRKMEPVFYVTDDPAIWQEFAVPAN